MEIKYFEDKKFTTNFRVNYLNDLLNKCNSKIDLSNNTDIKVLNDILLSKESNYDIHRITFDIQGVRVTGVLFETNKRKSLVIMQHGLLGTPEIMANMYEDRDSSNYSDITPRLVDMGFNVFMPQLLMWHMDHYGVPYCRNDIKKEYLEYGYTLIDVEIYFLNQIINYFSKNSKYRFIDMFGMSFGGLYTYKVAETNNKNVHKYCVFCYALKSTTPIADSPTNEELIETLKSIKTKHKINVILGEQDPLFDMAKTKELFGKLKKQFKVTYFEGEHEIIKDNKILKEGI